MVIVKRTIKRMKKCSL